MSQTPTPYTPPPDLLQNAIKALEGATPEELAAAEWSYDAYCAVTSNRSAVTGAEFPTFDMCPPLVRAAWLAAARTRLPKPDGPVAAVTMTAWTPEAGAAVVNLAQGHVGSAAEEGRIDPFLMGISEIAAATRDLAEAAKAVHVDSEAIAELVEDTAKALHSRVKALAAPPELTATA